ncbi:MAG TPA: hypothetical protein VFV41_14265 [Streptosporangiaceae bacterium]|nr:hypothetical protein [Streptosporangiaceae bacterium]
MTANQNGLIAAMFIASMAISSTCMHGWPTVRLTSMGGCFSNSYSDEKAFCQTRSLCWSKTDDQETAQSVVKQVQIIPVHTKPVRSQPQELDTGAS